MERITSRKNPLIRELRQLGKDAEARKKAGMFLCDGEKLLSEAVQNGAEIRHILFREGKELSVPKGVSAYTATDEVFTFASPLVNSPGPLFTVSFGSSDPDTVPDSVLVLENVQDPGNVGTVLRTAAAFGCGLVVLTGNCADPYNPKTVRASMGALFRQRMSMLSLPELMERLHRWDLKLYGAALDADSVDVRGVSLRRAAVAVGNEGAGLSDKLLDLCDKKIVIPMTPGSESLNAAVAASVLMWEMRLANR